MSNDLEPFDVTATTPEGEPYAETAVARNSAEVVASFRERGLQVSRVRPVRRIARSAAPAAEAFAAFNEMLASLTRHDIPLPDALRVLAGDMRRNRFRRAVEETGFVITVEEGTLRGGFGSAVLEAASEAGLRTDQIRCLGLPDRFIEHGERGELLAELGLDCEGFMKTARAMADRGELVGDHD